MQNMLCPSFLSVHGNVTHEDFVVTIKEIVHHIVIAQLADGQLLLSVQICLDVLDGNLAALAASLTHLSGKAAEILGSIVEQRALVLLL